jgi:hypothetical protein
MGTTIREGRRVSTRTGGPLENRSSEFSRFGDITQGEHTDPGADRAPENELTAEKSGPACSCDEHSALAAERALIDKILSGHKELFMDLIRPYGRTVYTTVFSSLANKEDAEDVAQDAFVKALACLNQFRKEPYLRTTTTSFIT